MSRVDTEMVERVFAGYARHFPEARRVPRPTNPLEYFAGGYSNDEPLGPGLSGRNLYLFPDGEFILTEWADIMPETALMRGSWSYEHECICLSGSAPRDVRVDLTYVTLMFSDAHRNLLVLMGTPHGFRFWTAWVAECEPQMRKARERYDSDVRVREDFRITTQAEEMLYVSFFAGTFVRHPGSPTGVWEAFRKKLLLRLEQSKM